MPIWRTEDGTEEVCIGSVEELTKGYLAAKEKGFNQSLDLKVVDGKLDVDLHKPYVDQIEILSGLPAPCRSVGSPRSDADRGSCHRICGKHCGRAC